MGDGQCEPGPVEKDYQTTDYQEHLESGRLEKGESRLHGIQQQEKRTILENKHGSHRSSRRCRSEERLWQDNPSRSGEHRHRQEVFDDLRI